MFGLIILRIGDPELDAICEQAIVPAIEACGLDARRVDKHNEGGLLVNANQKLTLSANEI